MLMLRENNRHFALEMGQILVDADF